METSIVIIIISMISLIIALVSIFLSIQFRKKDNMPIVLVGLFQESQNYFEISNHGGVITNLKINIQWLQDGVEKHREMEDFFNYNEDPTFGSPHKCDSLKKEETKKVIHCPRNSDNGEIIVRVEGIDLNKEKYFEKFIIKNYIKININ